MPLSRNTRRAFTPTLIAMLWSPSTLAHGDLDIGDFYQGIATVVLHWEQVLFLLVAGFWCAQQQQTQRPLIGGALVASMSLGLLGVMLGLRLPLTMLALAAAYGVLGLAVACQLRESLLYVLPLAIGAGLTNGLALGSNEFAELTQPILFSLGLALGAGMSLFYVSAAITRLPEGWPWIGVRIAGSWIAAIGLIVGAFALTPTA